MLGSPIVEGNVGARPPGDRPHDSTANRGGGERSAHDPGNPGRQRALPGRRSHEELRPSTARCASTRLLSARGPVLHALLARMFRMLASEGVSFDWGEMARFILNDGTTRSGRSRRAGASPARTTGRSAAALRMTGHERRCEGGDGDGPRFLQIHTLHSYTAALLNRDDSGLAKRMPFGRVMRTRISSQCLKRHWRTADDTFSIRNIPNAPSGHPLPQHHRAEGDRAAARGGGLRRGRPGGAGGGVQHRRLRQSGGIGAVAPAAATRAARGRLPAREGGGDRGRPRERRGRGGGGGERPLRGAHRGGRQFPGRFASRRASRAVSRVPSSAAW